MTMKLLAIVLALVSSVVAAAPASAQTAPTAAVTAPGDGDIVEGTITVRGRGSATAGVRSVKLFIEGTQVASREPSELRQDVDIDYVWDTATILGGSGIARNGWYQLKVVVVANGGGSTEATRNIRVNNPATSPTGLSVVTHEQRVNLSWDANPEPDIQAYRVEADRGSGFAYVGETVQTNFSYETSPGTYVWRVVALRSSPADEHGRASDPSATVSATIKAPPTTEGTKGGAKVVGDKKVYGGATTKEARHTLRQTARHFASGGISSAAISLPGTAIGLPNLPDTELEWGTYEEKLPYNLPASNPGKLEVEPVQLAARSTTHVLPQDALQWVAAGLLLVVTAGLLQLLMLRAEKKAQIT
ncbi:MAG: Ig-like domain-containing protein [Actinomycetota bacterium]